MRRHEWHEAVTTIRVAVEAVSAEIVAVAAAARWAAPFVRVAARGLAAGVVIATPARAITVAVLMAGTAATAGGTGAMAEGSRAASMPPSSATTLPLQACRLEHPLEIASVAARCGTLEVAEDPAHPQGAHIGLHVAVIPALNRRSRAAPLFLLAGGPGQAAGDLYVSYAGAFAQINRSHDIVLVDQRGTGKSQPLVCAYPEDWRQSAQNLDEVRRVTRACLDKYGERVRFYTSSVAVRDLDAVRAALGYGSIDLYAGSYGTRMAELYMRRYPAFTHAVILDGVTYPEQVIGPDTPLDAERALGLILARCAGAPECAAAFPALDQELQKLRDKFGPATSVLTLSDPSTGAPLELEFNRSVLGAALRFLSYNATEASLLPILIHEGAAGRLAPLAAQTVMLAREVGDQIASGMQNSVVCSEDVPYFDRAGIDRRELEATYQGTEQLDALLEICRIWPHGPVDADLHAPLNSDVPTLLLSGEADPVTPPADAERLARGLAHHRHLILQGEGHGQIATGCVPRLMARFLDDPDPAALDASCLDHHHPASFFLGMTGPAP
jgi:pimeloyl-ACP methyl ester carboxylesterase